MPALPDVPNVLRLTYGFEFSGGGPEIFPREYWEYSGTAPSGAQLDTFCDSAFDAFKTNCRGLFHAAVTMEKVEAIDLSSSTAAVGSSSHTPYTGTLSGATLTAEQAMVILYSVHRRYRGGHPKTFWPFGDQDQLTSDQAWNGTFTNGVDTDVSAYHTAVEALTWSGATIVGQVNVSYYEGFTVHTGTTGRARNVSTPRTSPVVDPVIAMSVPTYVSQQRRRRGRV